nr:hypothetical protein [uncultured Draconibacterium sp.]
MKGKSINNFMEDCRITTFNAADDEIISTRFAPFGYDETKHLANKTLYQKTTDIIAQNKIEHAEYDAARIDFNDAVDAARKIYSNITRSLQYWYGPETREALKLGLYNNKIARYADFVQAGKEFYTELIKHPDVMEKLVPFGHTQENITEYQTNINSLDDLRAKREKESGDAQYYVKVRNAKMDELADAVANIKRLGKLVFTEDEAQYLEKLGILVKS